MDYNRQKYVGREFLQRLADAVNNAGSVKPLVMELASTPADVRKDVARGLLAIAADDFESVFRRKYALNILATIIRVCGLSGDEEIREQLNHIVDILLSESKDDIDRIKPEGRPQSLDCKRLQKSALLALVASDRFNGLHRLNQTIARYENSDSEFARELRELRKLCFADQ